MVLLYSEAFYRSRDGSDFLGGELLHITRKIAPRQKYIPTQKNISIFYNKIQKWGVNLPPPHPPFPPFLLNYSTGVEKTPTYGGVDNLDVQVSYEIITSARKFWSRAGQVGIVNPDHLNKWI